MAVNQEGIVLQVNSQTEAMFGYTQEELVGQQIEILLPSSTGRLHRHHRKYFTEQPKVRRMGAGLDLRGRRRDGSEFAVEISLSPVSTSDGIVVLCAIRDVSDRKQMEEQLRRATQELAARKDRSALGISKPARPDCRFLARRDHWQGSGRHHYPLEQGRRTYIRLCSRRGNWQAHHAACTGGSSG